MLIGTTDDELLKGLHARRELFGLSYFVVRDSQLADKVSLLSALGLARNRESQATTAEYVTRSLGRARLRRLARACAGARVPTRRSKVQPLDFFGDRYARTWQIHERDG